MANADEAATYWNTPQYHGELLTIGAQQTPFLQAIGGPTGQARYKTAVDWQFAMNSNNSLDASVQQSITETASLAAPTPRNYDRAQEINVCQIFHKAVGASYAAQSATRKLSGLYIADMLEDMNEPLESNLMMTLKQLARDIEWHMLNGTYNLAANAGQANQMKGITSGITTNAVDASGGALATHDIDALVLLMKETSFAPLENPALYCRFSIKQKLTALYGVAPFAPPDNTIGGQAVDYIITDAGKFPVVACDQVAAATILLLDMNYISPVFLPKPEKYGGPGGLVFLEQLAKTGAATTMQLYGQVSIDYTTQYYHGKITNFI